MVVLPYLGQARASSELKQKGRSRGVDFKDRPEKGAKKTSRLARVVYHTGDDPLGDLPMRLTYRTARVLEAAVQYPGASNRVVGELAEISDQGQVSKLLARLQGLGLLTNTAGRDAHAKGAANAWSLTELGEQVTDQLSLNTNLPEEEV